MSAIDPSKSAGDDGTAIAILAAMAAAEAGARLEAAEAAESGSGPGAATRWKKGQSGNPAGRPKGAKNKATLLVQAMVEGEAVSLARQALDRAHSGTDSVMLRFFLARLVAAKRPDTTIEIELPLPPEGEIVTAIQTEQALGAVIRAVASGEISPADGVHLADLIERRWRIVPSPRSSGAKRPGPPSKRRRRRPPRRPPPPPLPRPRRRGRDIGRQCLATGQRRRRRRL